MAEISARDLRRLEALEGRFQKAEEQRKSLAAERRELRAAVSANARRAREMEKAGREAERKLEAVLAENAALAARNEEVTADLGRLQAASLELRDELDRARSELDGLRKELPSAREEANRLKGERDDLAKRLEIADEQLADKKIPPLLPAREVAKLIEGLLAELGAGLPGLAVREGQVQLQVAFGKVGRTGGFVVPTAETPPDVRENLHQLSIRFERTLEAQQEKS